MRRQRKPEVYLFINIQSFPNDNYALPQLGDTVISHIDLVQFHMIAQSCEIFKYHFDYLSLAEAQYSFYIFCYEILRLLLFYHFAEKAIERVSVIIYRSSQVS